MAPVVAAIAYLSAGIWIASHFATWTDEEYTLATTAHGAAYAIRRAIDYELQAPLYFAVLAVWRLADPSVAFARLFSLLCAAAFFFALVAVGRRVAPSGNPLPFALLVATNPFVLKAAFDGDTIRDQARAALKLDIGERLRSVRDKLSTDLAFGNGQGCVKAAADKIEVSGVHVHAGYLRVYVNVVGRASVYLPCPG